MGMKILITGGCGFVGSSLSIALKTKYPGYTIIAFDNLKRNGSELNINRLKEAGIIFMRGDVRNKRDLDNIELVDLIIHTAGETSVLAGLNSSSDYLFETNLNGTINCLNLALKFKAAFLFLSTSRVYPIKDINSINYVESDTRFEIAPDQVLKGISKYGIAENFPLLGNGRSLYGVTKLSLELIINEYNELFGLKSVVNRCGVITGPWQMGKIDQGVIVLWVAKHFWKGELSYFGYGGEGKQVRDILHVNDLINLIDYQIHNLDAMNGNTFNVGGGRDISVSLQELTTLCQEITGNIIEIKKVEQTRAADIRTYITDNTKVSEATGWRPVIPPGKIVTDIFEWIKNNENSLAHILN